MRNTSLPALTLVCGILSWFVCPVILGVAAWIMGNQGLAESRRDPSYPPGDVTLLHIGKILGMINVLLYLFGFCIFGGMLMLGLSIPFLAGPNL